jgi:hypothetical protein
MSQTSFLRGTENVEKCHWTTLITQSHTKYVVFFYVNQKSMTTATTGHRLSIQQYRKNGKCVI